MPDPISGRLSEADIRKVQEWVTSRVPGGPLKCTVCGVSKWIVGQELTAPVSLVATNLIPTPDPQNHPAMRFDFSGRVYPQVQILCANCGHTLLFNAIVLGITFGDWRPHEELKSGGGNG
jgi:hypothetical protein